MSIRVCHTFDFFLLSFGIYKQGTGLFYCVRSEENVQKPQKMLIPENAQIVMVFVRFLLTECSTTNSDHLPPTNPSKFS